MSGLSSLPLRAASLAGLLLLAGTGAPLAQQRVGVNGAVNPEATGAPPGGTARKLVIGQDVIFNEHIATAEAGQTQLMFLDESAMTVGPNSDLTIDQFVYDPRSGTGKLAMSATRGLLRYVGGKLSKQDGAVTVRTNTATLAVRGGAFILNVDRNGKTEAIFIFGDGLTLTGLNGISQTVLRPGFEITVVPGGAPSAPAPVPPGRLAGLVQQLDGRAGGTGGASTIPTDTSVANSGVSQTISGNLTASVQQAAQNQVGAQNQGSTSFVNPPTASNPVTQANQIIDCTTAGTCNTNNTVPVVTNPPPPPPPPPGVTFAGRAKSTNGGGTARGFVDQTANGDIPYASGAVQNGVFTAAIGSLGTVSFPLAAAGSSANLQGNSTTLGTLTGTSSLSADGNFFYANITPTSQPAQRVFISGGVAVNPGFYQTTGAGARPQAGSNTRLFAFTVQPDAALQSNIPFIRSQTGGNLANASVSPFYIVAPSSSPIGDTSTAAAARGMQASLAINGQGANQQSAIAVTAGTVGSQLSGQPIFNGQMRGSSLQSASGSPVALRSAVSSTVDGNGNSFYGGSTISGFALDQTAYATTSSGIVGGSIIPSTASETPLSGAATTYGFAQPALPTAVPSGVGASRTTQALTGTFGGLVYTNAQPNNPYIVTGSSLVSTDASNNRVQATLSGTAQSPSAGVTSVTTQYGSLTGAAGSQSFVDDNTYAAQESQVNPQQITINGTASQPSGSLYLVSSGSVAAPTSLLPSGASYCQCQYLQWGYWGGDLTTAGSPGGTARIDAGHINTWVAGVPTPLNDLNSLQSLSATASYSGHAIGSVFNNGANYVAAGGFNGTYNFGTQSGTMSINNFDGHSFTASGKAPLSGPNYSFGVTSPGVTGAINGTFYGPKAAETGGNFAVQTTVGPTYLASGIYAGKQ